MSFWRQSPKAPLGTPENPEIIEPGQTRAQVQPTGRLRMILQILWWMVSAAFPAWIFDSICLWLFDQAVNHGAVLAWVPLILLAPVSALLTILAVFLCGFFAIMLVAALFGKTVSNRTWVRSRKEI